MIKNKKKITILVTLLVALAIVAGFLLYNTYYADTTMPGKTGQNSTKTTSGTATTSAPVSSKDQELAKKVFEIEKTSYAGRNAGVGKIVRVKEYLRVDIGDNNNDAIDTYLYKVNNNNDLTKIQMIDIEGTVVENNPNLGKPAYISQEDWQKLIFSNYE